MKFWPFYIIRFILFIFIGIYQSETMGFSLGLSVIYFAFPMLLIGLVFAAIFNGILVEIFEEDRVHFLLMTLILCGPDLVYLTAMSEGRVWYYGNGPLKLLILLLSSTVLFFILQKLKIISIPKE